MKVDVKIVDSVTIVELEGAIDGNTAPVAQEQILPLVRGSCRLLVDMRNVEYMSSSGLRMMLLLYRQVAGVGGRIVLAGLSEEIRDTMSLTGFLDFFATADSVEAGLAALA
jgi:anti-sigma B factor antagonist